MALTRLFRWSSIGEVQPGQPHAIRPSGVAETFRQGAFPGDDLADGIQLTLQVVADAVDNGNGLIEALREKIASAAERAAALARQSAAFDEAARGTTAIADTLATPFDGFSAAAFVEDAGDLAAARLLHNDALQAGVEALGEDIACLGSLSRHGRLLSLNAALVAARAPQVTGAHTVALESRLLADRLGAAVDGVSARLRSIEAASMQGRVGMAAMIGVCAKLATALEAMRKQDEGHTRQHRLLNEALAAQAADMAALRRSAAELAEIARDAEAGARAARHGAHELGELLKRLRPRAAVLARGSGESNRRSGSRVPMKVPGTLEVFGARFAVTTLELAAGGCVLALIDADVRKTAPALAPGSMASVALEGIGIIAVTLEALSELGYHVRFGALTPHAGERLRELVEQAHHENRAAVALVTETADRIARTFTQGLGSGEIAADDLFSSDYTPIRNSDPVQYTTPSLAFCKQVLPPLLQAARASPLGPLFVLATDRNAYAPVHHPEFSLLQRLGEAVWNDLNARDRRIYDRGLTLSGARNRDSYSLRAYMRHQADGAALPIQVVAAPIVVNGQFWGNAQAGFALP